jgi:DNA polymerase
MTQRYLLIDIETYSEADLSKVGVYRYAADPSFKLLLLGYRWLDRPDETKVVDVTAQVAPLNTMKSYLLDPNVIKVAHNANFERVCLGRYLGVTLDPAQWSDTMVMAAEYGLPRSLADLSAYLSLGEAKDTRGKSLIARFSKPYRGKRVLPSDDPGAWAEFVEYCRQDVATEARLWEVLPKLSEAEQALWELDQAINDAGIGVDLALARRCVTVDEAIRAANFQTMKDVTGLDNPNSGQQLMGWLQGQGAALPNLLAETVDSALDGGKLPQAVKTALGCRRAMNNSSAKKYGTILECAIDDRVHGLLSFYGAHTGRWAGRLVQVQNLPRGTMSNYDKDGEWTGVLDTERAHVLAGQPTNGEGLKSLVRTTFIPRPGNKFYVADFSAIEARVLAWLAGEEWVLGAFRRGDDIYKTVAAQIYKVEYTEVTKEQRQRGKVAVLACGYQGAVGAMERMGGKALGLTETEMQAIVTTWRKSNPNIVRFWRDLEAAVRTSWESRGRLATVGQYITVRCHKPVDSQAMPGVCLTITLPSGRGLVYHGLRVTDKISFTEGKGREDTYGGKLTENIVQAVARDLLGEALLTLDLAGYEIVAHVHDEVIIEGPEGLDPLGVRGIMATPPSWAGGLPMDSSIDTWDYYQK